jgi:hypothetical protein
MNNILLDKIDKSHIKIISLQENKNDFQYWQTQPYEIRLAVLEQIRNEYNTWKYGTEQGFQRVYSITEQK